MTREEAIKILKSKLDGSVDTSWEWTEAVRMAIEALSNANQHTQRVGCVDCNDLVYRAEVENEERAMSMISEQVKRLRKLANQWKHNDVAGFNLIFEAADTIEALSAKGRAADRPTGECKDCTHWDKLDYEAPRQGWCYQFEEFTDADEYCSRCAMMRGESHEVCVYR